MPDLEKLHKIIRDLRQDLFHERYSSVGHPADEYLAKLAAWNRKTEQIIKSAVITEEIS